MNNCLCESCCNKDYCLIYQDYKNPDGIVAEPITACGRYKKLYIIEDTYTKEEVIAMLTELKTEIEEVEIFKNVIGWELTHKTPTNIKQDCIAIIQQKINALKGVNR